MKHFYRIICFYALFISTSFAQLIAVPPSCPISGVSITDIQCNTNNAYVDFKVNFTTSGGTGDISVFITENGTTYQVGQGTSSPISCSMHFPIDKGTTTVNLGYGFNSCASATYTHPICAVALITDIKNNQRDLPRSLRSTTTAIARSSSTGSCCGCEDADNIKNSQGVVTHFHDVLEIIGNPGEDIVLTAGGSHFLDANLAIIPNGTTLGTIPASGLFEFSFFHAAASEGNISLTAGGTTVTPDPLTIDACNAASCPVADPIPTMSEWGMMIFGLLIINLSVFFMRREEMVWN